MATTRIRAGYVEVPVTDVGRAARFYAALFGVPVRLATIDGHPAALIDDADEDEHHRPGALIALMQGESYVPSVDGTRVYVTVPDVEATVAGARRLGGEQLYPPTPVDDTGLIVAEIRDSEGNRIALSNR